MENEKPNETDTEGKKPDTIPKKPEEPLSIISEAKKVRDELREENDRREKILQEEKKLISEGLLSGTTGGHVELKQVSPEDAKKAQAEEFFKDTALGDAIGKVK